MKSKEKDDDICDGKSCGTGTYAGFGKYVCIHNNLYVLRPDLMEEWSDKNELDPKKLTIKSHKSVWWKCKNDPCGCHSWQARIYCRTAQNTNCPFCLSLKICPHNSLEAVFPKIAAEWHPTKNGKIKPSEVAPHSYKKYWWKCKKDPCGCHKWSAVVYSRTSKNKTDCPFCSGMSTCAHNSLEAEFPEIAIEWHPTKNGKVTPNDISPATGSKYWWKCKKDPCGCHVWEARVYCRTSKKKNCPFCSGRSTCSHSSLKARFPKIADEWHPTKNGSVKASEIAPGCNKKYWWKCSKEHEWCANVNCRTSSKSGCPHCARLGYSKKQIIWLENIEKEEGVKIRKATSKHGEYKVEGVGRVDGYCKKTNTIYEFHGDYWHGHPQKYDPEDINEVNGETFSALYRKTRKRDKKIRSLGYNLVVKWETDIVDN